MKLHRLLLSLVCLCLIAINAPAADAPVLRFGIVTDVHYADKPGQKRAYRESIAKLTEATSTFTASNAAFAVELGDFIDSAKNIEDEIGHARTIEAVFAKFTGPRHHVIGNHDVDALTKPQFMQACAMTNTNSYYSFDTGPYHFVVLDACFRADGVSHGARQASWTDASLPKHELDWLAADLKAANKPTICFVHQRLDTAEKSSGTENAAAVRAVFEKSGRVLAVFQGHAHINIYNLINSIHYVTFSAMVQTPCSHALVEILPDDTIVITGFGGQKSMRLEHRAPGQLSQATPAGTLAQR